MIKHIVVSCFCSVLNFQWKAKHFPCVCAKSTCSWLAPWQLLNFNFLKNKHLILPYRFDIMQLLISKTSGLLGQLLTFLTTFIAKLSSAVYIGSSLSWTHKSFSLHIYISVCGFLNWSWTSFLNSSYSFFSIYLVKYIWSYRTLPSQYVHHFNPSLFFIKK